VLLNSETFAWAAVSDSSPSHISDYVINPLASASNGSSSSLVCDKSYRFGYAKSQFPFWCDFRKTWFQSQS